MKEKGFALITTFLLMAVLTSLLSAYFFISKLETQSVGASKNSISGFYAAEGGLNLTAEAIRTVFVGFNRPAGSPPTTSTPCFGGDTGSGDYACETYTFGNHQAVTYSEEDPANPVILTIPAGEQYQNLNAQEYRFTTNSTAYGPANQVEAILELKYKSRLVPLFQFAAFYDKDLEIAPGPTMNLSGPVHTNGDLFLNSGNTLNVNGQVTIAGDMFRGRKNNTSCGGNVRVIDPGSLRSVPSCSGGRTPVTEPDVAAHNGMIQIGVDEVTVPGPEVFDPTPGQIYWDNAELRLALTLPGFQVQAYGQSGSVDSVATNALNNLCTTGTVGPGNGVTGRPVGWSTSFFNNREGMNINMLDIDLQALLNCAQNEGLFALDDTSEGGLVIHLSVFGPDSNVVNDYGVRVLNGEEITSTVPGAPAVQGLSIISDQAMYLQGHFNRVNKIPAAVMVDSFNVLSSNWDRGTDGLSQTGSFTGDRRATDTTQNTAVIAGTDITCGVEGNGGGSSCQYNGGLENYPRFHEHWSSRTYTYRGSFVSLDAPQRVDGNWSYGNPQYTAPNRDWDYDTDFNDAANLPPITPRFVYLRQELFVRDFEQ